MMLQGLWGTRFNKYGIHKFDFFNLKTISLYENKKYLRIKRIHLLYCYNNSIKNEQYENVIN